MRSDAIRETRLAGLMNVIARRFIERGEVLNMCGTQISCAYRQGAQRAIQAILVDGLVASASPEQQTHIASVAQWACGDKLIEGILFGAISKEMPQSSELESLEIPTDMAATIARGQQLRFTEIGPTDKRKCVSIIIYTIKSVYYINY